MDPKREGHDESPKDLRKLKRIVLLRGSAALGMLGLILFVPAGTIWYWEGLVYLAMIAISASVVLSHFLRSDPELIERRMRMKEKEPGQKKIVAISYVVFLFAFLTPGLDHRFGWSSVPPPIVVAADLAVMLGYLIVVAVLKTNRYASRIIEVEPGQRVVTSGPYALVRHPMYAGVLLMYVGSPLALGSWWGMLASVWFLPLLAARIVNEEQVLRKELAGYPEYARKTRYRLFPGLW